MKFIIVDWLNNLCFDSDMEDLQTMDDASEHLDLCLRRDCNHTCNPDGCLCDSMGEDGESLEELREDYYIQEYTEDVDRIMWNGRAFVFKQNYYAE